MSPALRKPSEVPLQWGGEAIWQQAMEVTRDRTDSRLAGFSVEILPSVDSTNSELMRRARAGQTEPTLLVAEHQTAGRGRMGRVWQSDPGSSLAFSMGLLLSPQAWDGLSLAVGVSVAHHLLPETHSRGLSPAIQLKWPNDLWCQDRKLAGILIETIATPAAGGLQTAPAPVLTACRYVVVGIGINIAPRAAQGLSTLPIGLQELWPQATAPEALARIATPLLRDMLLFEAQGFAPFATRFAASDALYGRDVSLSDGRSGMAQGVDHQGALLVHTPQGVQRISSAEVSVRPIVRDVHN